MDLQHFPVLTSSIERWESLQLWAYEDSADLVCQHISLSCARQLKLICASNPSLGTPKHIAALVGTTPNLQSLCIQFGLEQHCAYTRSIDSIVINLSHLRLSKSALDCECTWRMLWHFRGTVSDLSSCNCLSLPRDEPLITFPDLQILRLQMHWNDILLLLPLLDAPTLQILDLSYSRSSFNADAEWLFDRLLKLKLPLLEMRIGFECWWIGSFLPIASYLSDPFGGSYNIIRTGNPKTEEPPPWGSCYGGTLDTWNFCRMESFTWCASGSCRLLIWRNFVRVFFWIKTFWFFSVWRDEKGGQ